MTAVSIALVGMGKMGRAIDALAGDRECEVVARLGAPDTARGITRELLKGAQVAIDFTEPASAVANARQCMEAGTAIVIGTTGWSAQMAELEAAVRDTGGRALWSPNFSLGVQLFLLLAEDAATLFSANRAFDVHLVETHHSAKKDAPSGTALAIVERLEAGGSPAVPVTSIRTGHVPGTHEVLFDGHFEQVRLVHEARDRRVFADGALHAARWLASQDQPGLYTMRDVIRVARNEASS